MFKDTCVSSYSTQRSHGMTTTKVRVLLQKRVAFGLLRKLNFLNWVAVHGCVLCGTSLMHMNMYLYILFCTLLFMVAKYHNKGLKTFKADLSKTKYVKLCT